MPHNMIKKIVPFLLLVFVCVFANAQKKSKSTQHEDPFAGLDTTFEKILKDWHGAGFAVAVVEKNKVIYAKGFGYRDLENKLPVTPTTLFAIGSCTKAFTASILGILQKDGKLELNKPVRNYLPELKFFNDNMNNQILLSDLMAHRTGLPRHDYSWYGFPTNSRDSLMKRIQYMEPTYGIREKWQYNNFMYVVQGLVAEKITNTSWEKNVKEKLFDPLEMKSSNFSIVDLQKNNDASIGYGLKKDSIIKKLDYFNINAMGPAGSINSNVLEMSNWVITWINGGKFKGKEIIPANYLNEAMGSQMVVGTGTPTKEKPDVFFSTYGFGWMQASYKGHLRVEHGGNIDGFSASTCFFPSDSIGIIVLSNQNGSTIPSIVRNTVADRILKLPYFDWNNDLKKSTAKAKAAEKEVEKNKTSNQKLNTQLSHALKDYEGIYQHPGYGSFEVSVRNDSLICKIGKDVLWLRNYHYDIFEPFDIDPKDGIDTTDRSPMRIAYQMNEAGDFNSIGLAMEPTLPALKFTKTPKPKEITEEELKKYVGDYDLSGAATVKVYIKDNKTLFVLVPGQPDYELIPIEKDKFSLKIINGYFVQFEINDKGVSTELTFIQPNGNFKAKKKL
jgi:CubicO group peptidase (beta-lactamase class C family)